MGGKPRGECDGFPGMFGEIDRNEDPPIDEVTFFRRDLNTLLGRS
jgi:hypothetical protein